MLCYTVLGLQITEESVDCQGAHAERGLRCLKKKADRWPECVSMTCSDDGEVLIDGTPCNPSAPQPPPRPSWPQRTPCAASLHPMCPQRAPTPDGGFGRPRGLHSTRSLCVAEPTPPCLNPRRFCGA